MEKETPRTARQQLMEIEQHCLGLLSEDSQSLRQSRSGQGSDQPRLAARPASPWQL